MAARRRVAEEVSDTIKVTVLRLGGRVQHVDLEKGSTVEDAVEEAGFTVKSSDEVSVNQEVFDHDDLGDTEVQDGDRIVLTPKFEGGSK